MEITLNLTVDELVAEYPEAAGFLADHHVVCIVCGEPYWGTLGDLMTNKGIQDPEALVGALREHLSQE